MIGDGLTRDFTRKINAAFVSALSPLVPSGPAAGDYTHVRAGALTDLDAYAHAVSVAAHRAAQDTQE